MCSYYQLSTSSNIKWKPALKSSILASFIKGFKDDDTADQQGNNDYINKMVYVRVYNQCIYNTGHLYIYKYMNHIMMICVF